jgi:cytochrome c peroxidase
MNWTSSPWPATCLAAVLVLVATFAPHGDVRGEGVARDAAAAPRDEAAAIELGRMLFFDPKLSGDKWVSCASCHQPGLVFSDGRAHAKGVHKRNGLRNTPSLLDVAQQRSMFWDGRRAGLEQQALDPLLNSAEHGLVDNAELLEKLRTDPRYPAAFESAYGLSLRQVRVDDVARALATYQRTLVSGTNAFDRFLAGQADALSPSARRGWTVFDQQAQCTRCHVVEEQRPLLTDHRFHPFAPGAQQLARKLPDLRFRLAELHREGQMFSDKVLSDPDISEAGRFAFTLDAADVASFKTPSLRNVALTAPYMHNGSVATLAEAVDLEVYCRGAREERPLILTPAEREDLIAFLHALTGDAVAKPPPMGARLHPEGETTPGTPAAGP